MTLKEQAEFILYLVDQKYMTVDQATHWAGKMFEQHDYEKLDQETQDALGSVEILDIPTSL